MKQIDKAQFENIITGFTPGDLVDTGQGDFGYGKIIDIFRSTETDNCLISILFTRNIGKNSSAWGGDIIFCNPENTAGIEMWEKIDIDNKGLTTSIIKRNIEMMMSVNVFLERKEIKQ